MKKLIILFFTVVLGLGCNNARAGYQPHVFLPEANIYTGDEYIPDTTMPVRRVLVNQQAVQPAQIRQVQLSREALNQQAQNPVLVTREKRDTALVRRLYEVYKPAIVSSPEKIKVKRIIDSLVLVKQDPANPGTTPGVSYDDLVRILDSLLKANQIETKKSADSPLVSPVVPADITAEKKEGRQRGFLRNNWWMIIAGIAGLALLVVLLKRKRKDARGSRIFFSYAWDQDEAFVMQLYNSLKRDGFNVVKDKENMGYKGVISKFMHEIGGADFVVVAISDKYLRSKFCMYELYELYKNSGMNAEKFNTKLFPVRIDETLNLGDPDTVNVYVRYWQEQEDAWAKRMREESESITEEQARQYQFVKRLVIDVRNILSCLADINALNLQTLRANDFADIKAALSRAMGM